jgi:hypothetical protein
MSPNHLYYLVSKFLPLLAVLFAFSLPAQTFEPLAASVFANNVELKNAWAGGLNAPQWSKVDLNSDGKQDLYLFDRNGGVHLAFVNIGNAGEAKYRFESELTADFPVCENFALMRDYNGDGIGDLFCHAGDEGLPAIKVYKGAFQNNRLVLQRLKMNWEFDVLTIPTGGGFSTNILVNSPDLPAIDDVDGDGDIDVLGLNGTGSKIMFYQNKVVERGLSKESFLFEIGTNCWGNIFILPFSQSLTLSGSLDSCAINLIPDSGENGEPRRHGGATLGLVDLDGDGDKDVMYGDLIYSQIVYGINGGNKQKAWINAQDTTFPSYDTPILINEFPAVHFLDIDNDGLFDLVASPNLPQSTFDRKVAWFYRNSKAKDPSSLRLQTREFLINEMIDLGTGASPAFVDFNADGLQDLVLANFSAYLPNFMVDPIISLWKNTGTQTNPRFQLADENWLDFRRFMDDSFAFAPSFGDMDGDGDLDLIVGERYGRLFFAENIAGQGKPFSFANIQPYWKGITVGQYSTPVIYDLNEDGLPDLIIGERNGNVNFLPNIGTKTSPQFHYNPDEAPNNPFLGKINTQREGWVTGYSSPAVIKTDSGTYIISGSEYGYLHLYKVNKDSLAKGAFNSISKSFGSLRAGNITRPAFSNLNGDRQLDMIIGNYRGGASLYSSPFKLEPVPARETAFVNSGVSFGPLPAGDFLNYSYNMDTDIIFKFEIIDVLGRKLKDGIIQKYANFIDISQLSSGYYFLRLWDGQSSFTKKIVKQ